jgi:chromosome segregation ATPase
MKLDSELKGLATTADEVQTKRVKVQREIHFHTNRYNQLCLDLEANRGRKATLMAQLSTAQDTQLRLECEMNRSNHKSKQDAFFSELQATLPGFRGALHGLIQPIQK